VGRPTVLFVPPPGSRAVFRSVLRVDDATRAALGTLADVIEIGTSVGRPREFLADLARVRDRVDVVFDHSGLPLTGPAAPELPVLLWALGNLPHGASLLSSRRRQLKSTDTLLVSSSADLEILARTLPDGGISGHLVPFAVDTERFRPPLPGDRTAARVTLGLPAEPPLLAYAGRLNIQKNVHLLLDLLSQLDRHHPGAHLAIAGTEDQTELKELGIKNHGYRDLLVDRAERELSGRVHFLGDLRPRRGDGVRLARHRQ